MNAIRWGLGPAWPSSAPLRTLVLEVLPTIEDDFNADLVESLMLADVERHEELNAIRMLLSVALSECHRTQQENARLRQRLIQAQRRSA